MVGKLGAVTSEVNSQTARLIPALAGVPEGALPDDIGYVAFVAALGGVKSGAEALAERAGVEPTPFELQAGNALTELHAAAAEMAQLITDWQAAPMTMRDFVQATDAHGVAYQMTPSPYWSVSLIEGGSRRGGPI